MDRQKLSVDYFRSMGIMELKLKLTELRGDLMRVRTEFKGLGGPPTHGGTLDTSLYRNARRNVARALTILREKETAEAMR